MTDCRTIQPHQLAAADQTVAMWAESVTKLIDFARRIKRDGHTEACAIGVIINAIETTDDPITYNELCALLATATVRAAWY